MFSPSGPSASPGNGPTGSSVEKARFDYVAFDPLRGDFQKHDPHRRGQPSGMLVFRPVRKIERFTKLKINVQTIEGMEPTKTTADVHKKKKRRSGKKRPFIKSTKNFKNSSNAQKRIRSKNRKEGQSPTAKSAKE